MLKILNYSKSYGETKIFTDFNLHVENGQALGIKGYSGCGKTTLLRSITGIDNEYTGDIFINGAVMSTAVEPSNRSIALVMQEPVLWEHMSVRENILFPVAVKERKNSNGKLEEITKSLGVFELLNRMPSKISGGQAKRVSFARGLMASKDILLLDEPLSNVDSETKEKILTYLKGHVVGKKTILYVSHDSHELDMFCNNIIEI